jgi:hypothetical protein
VVIVNTPTFFVSSYGSLIRSLEGRTTPARILVLGSGIESTRVSTIDEGTVEVAPEGGFLAKPGTRSDSPAVDHRYLLALFDGLYRDAPFTAGEEIGLGDVTVTLQSVTADGRPEAARFRFPLSLDHPTMRWLQWENGVYEPFQPPPVGGSVSLPPPAVPLPAL